MKMSLKTAILSGLAVIGLSSAVSLSSAMASGSSASAEHEMEHLHWHFNGFRGTYDRAAMQRGYQVYREVCASCHQLKHLAFRHLGDEGGPYYDEDYPNPNDNPYVKAFAADWQVNDIDSETGDPITRPGIAADMFPAIYPNAIAAAAGNGGAVPPDLSVIVSARSGGADYVYNLLISYGHTPPADVHLSPGTYYNPVFDGGAIAMAPPLSDDLIEFADGSPSTTEQMARDVTEFLAWSSDPKMEQRKRVGLMTMIYLLILSGLLWFAYKRVWKGVDH